MRKSHIPNLLQRVWITAVVLAAAAACDRPADDSSIAGGSAEGRRPASEQLAAATGLSHMPVPVNGPAFTAAIRRHYPPQMLRERRGGDVLVDVRLDESGRVLGATAVDNRAAVGNAAGRTRMVVIDRAPGSDLEVQREVPLNYDPQRFGAAAEAAVREVRFRPALRGGTPVPYTLRMTVRFSPSDAL
jgi:hypothetical protein